MNLNKYSKIYRVEHLEGVLTPAIIHNGGSYFFIDLQVFENGRIDCWHLEDFESFILDVEKGWVATSVPENEVLSISGLGHWQIHKGEWSHDKNSFVDYIWNIVKSLNPMLINIYKYSQKKVNEISISESGNGITYTKDTNDLFSEKIKGRGIDLFLKKTSRNTIESVPEYHLVRLDIFDESSITVSRIESPFEINLFELEEMIENQKIISQPQKGSKINILDLGSYIIHEQEYAEHISNKLLEIKDLISTLQGNPSAVELCRITYDDYLDKPSEDLKENLKIAYENIPEHQRRFVGDMDTKDSIVCKVIYGK